MKSTGIPPGAEAIDLLQSLEKGEWIRLVLPAMQEKEVGPASQTLGGFLSLTYREGFYAAETIADRAGVPVRTARNHLRLLIKAGWLQSLGRQLTPGGRLRKTPTLRVTEKTKGALRASGVLPRWAASQPFEGESLTWGAKAVLSLVLVQLMTLKAAVDREEPNLNSDDLWASIWNLDAEYPRFRFPLKGTAKKPGLEKLIGLEHKAIIGAKHELARRGIIEWSKGDGRGHILYPRDDFRAYQWQADEAGECFQF